MTKEEIALAQAKEQLEQIEQYVNQRVIEELEDLLQFPEHLVTNIVQRIKELKERNRATKV